MSGYKDILKKHGRKVLLLLCLIVASRPVASQNLVLNPDFENVNGPSLLCTLYGPPIASTFNPAINNWTCPTQGTSDIYSSLLSTHCSSYPLAAAFGGQAPRSGNTMVGFVYYMPQVQPCPYREYVQGNLSTPLIAGTTYNISFYVSLADDCKYAVGDIGLKFSTTPVNVGNNCPYTVVPDVSYNGTAITDSNGWTKLEFCYTPAVSGLQHFVIGNFLSNAATTVATTGGFLDFSYYYIDDVSIMPASSVFTPTVTLTPFCGNPTATLTALPAGMSYSWTAPAGGTLVSGATTQNALVQGSGIFTLSVQSPTICGIGPVSSTTVMLNPSASVAPFPPVAVGSGSLTCTVHSRTLSASSSPGVSYAWSGIGIVSGSNTATVVINAPGSYSVTVTNAGGCSATSTVDIRENTEVPIVTSTFMESTSCSTPTLQLEVVFFPASCTFTWTAPPTGTINNTGVFDPIISGSGIFTVTATDPASECTAVSETTIEAISEPLLLSVNSATLCAGSSASLTISGSVASYSWSPASSLSASTGSSVVASPTLTTVYSVTAAINSCTATTNATVTVQPGVYVDAGRDTTINLGDYVTLSGRSNVEAGFFALSPVPLMCHFCSTIRVNPEEATCYVLKSDDRYACRASDTVCVQVIQDYAMYIPNSFTPNADGINDVFLPVGYGLREISLAIYDRWGDNIFTSNDRDTGWDGSRNGKLCEQGVYVYQLEAKTATGTSLMRTGHVVLLPGANPGKR
jgi:gliding motility-associated-like protein